jgi:L-rhamnose mutarotase
MIKALKMRLEYGRGPEYERRRAETWPEVEQMIVFHVD